MAKNVTMEEAARFAIEAIQDMRDADNITVGPSLLNAQTMLQRALAAEPARRQALIDQGVRQEIEQSNRAKERTRHLRRTRLGREG